jgi:Rps23 Pro-64 3,4-dihydroxylase Tpa1-like proline 4-hydroxylase
MIELLDRLLPYDKLSDKQFVQSIAREYADARPYPHVCIDGLFDNELLRRIAAEFPPPVTLGVSFQNEREIKRATKSEREIPTCSRVFIHALNSAPFVEFLEQVTSINGLVADPHLSGGGLHALERGGKLSIHTDFNYHKRLRLDRRVNVLIYLNEHWLEDYGGHFEAWRYKGVEAEARYLPTFNRMVIFATTDFTFHGNPDPVNCPPDIIRKSIAMYYYSNGRPKSEWRGIQQTTRFVNRPGESVARPALLRDQATLAMPRPLREWLTRHVRQRFRS